MKRLPTLLLLLLAVPPVSAAQGDARALADVLAPYVDDRLVGVAHLDVKGVDVDALVARAAALTGVKPAEVEGPRRLAKDLQQVLAGHQVQDVFLVLTLADLPARPPFLVLPVGPGGDAEKLARALRDGGMLGSLVPKQKGRAVVIASDAVWERLEKLEPVARPDLPAALAGAGGGLARLVLVGTADTRRIFEEVMPSLPAALGGDSIQVLTRGLRWAAVRVEKKDGRLVLEVVLQGATAEAAQKLEQVAATALKLAAADEQVRRLVPGIDRLLKKLELRREGARLSTTLTDTLAVDLLRDALVRQRGAAQRAQDMARMKQIGLAMHIYHDRHRHFPPAASHDAQGRPLLSWRVHLLPYLDQKELYEQLKLDEPWDSEHNRKLIARMPPIFRPANAQLAAAGKTVILAPTGEDTIFAGKEGVKLQDITDGTSNTILAVEADDSEAVVWTRPQDLPVDPKKPLRGVGGQRPGGFLALFADGSVRLLPGTIKPDTLKALFTRNGGEVASVP